MNNFKSLWLIHCTVDGGDLMVVPVTNYKEITGPTDEQARVMIENELKGTEEIIIEKVEGPWTPETTIVFNS